MSEFAQRRVWEKPKVRKLLNEDGSISEESMHEDWLELFSDLMIVAAYLQMSATLGHHAPRWDIMFCTFLNFWNIYQGTWALSLYVNRIFCNDWFRLITMGLVPFGTCIMVLCLSSEPNQPNYRAAVEYSFGFALSRLGLFLIHLRAWLTIDDVTRQLMFQAISYFCSAAVMVGTSLAGVSLYGWGNAVSGSCVAFIEVIAILWWLPWNPLWRAPGIKVGLNIGHYKARQGIAIMVALGESIIQLLKFTALPWWQELFTIGGISLSLSFAFIWFDTQPHHIEDHVIRRSWQRFLVSIYTMPVLLYSLFMLGTGYEILLQNVPSTPPKHDDTRLQDRRLMGNHSSALPWSLEESCALFSVSMGTACVLITWHRHSHAGLEGLRGKRALMLGCLRAVWCVMQYSWFALVLLMPVEQSTMPLLLIWGHLLLNTPVVLSKLWLPPAHRHDGSRDGGSFHFDPLQFDITRNGRERSLELSMVDSISEASTHSESQQLPP